MNTIEKIRQIGANIAYENEIFGEHRIDEIPESFEIVDDFIDRVKDDLFEFNTLEQFDNSYFNLFNRAFMYVYGKDAEFALFNRLGFKVSRINYAFDQAMQGICGERLPNHIRFHINKKSSLMLDMYG
jgi:hypothetical protein